MAKFTDKLSEIIKQQAPDFVLADHPKFLEWVKAYYAFMECGEMTLSGILSPDNVQLETATATTNYLLLNSSDSHGLDKEDKILFEDTTYGHFQNGEVITGSTSGATSTILVEDLDNSRIFINAENKFIEGETISGSISSSIATVAKYRANPVQNIQQLLDYPDPDKTIQGFLIKFRNAFLQTIPETLYSGVDKRKLIKNVKSLYRAKGTKRASELFFRLLFNESAEIIYPKEQMLRVSDGDWDTRTVIRVKATGTDDLTKLIGQQITQPNDPSDYTINEATAIVESVVKLVIGGTEITEITLGKDTIVGTFVIGQVLSGTDNTDEDVLLSGTITGCPDVATITNDGHLYSTGDTIPITGGGTGATMQVNDTGRGGIESIIIDTVGSGYEIGDTITFTNTDTGGSSAQAKVSVVNGAIAPESGTTGMTSTDHITYEDETVRGDPYTGDKIVQESGTGTGDITDIRMIESGHGYGSLPTVVVTSSGGSNAVVLAYGSQIGRVQSLKTIELGYDYNLSPTPPTIELPTYIVVTSPSASFTSNDTITGGTSNATAAVVNYISGTQVLKVKTVSNGPFQIGETITASPGGATATISKIDVATATTTVDSVVVTQGSYITEDGFISENTMKVQDSLYYQDYSYVIKVGRSIADWRDSYKKTLPPSGFYFTGQVNIQSQLDLKLRNVTGINTGVVEVIQGVIKIVFAPIIGRRLGTASDGTALRANPHQAVYGDLTDSTAEHFTPNTRDLTLNKAITLSMRSGGTITAAGTEIRRGFLYAGPRFNSINREVFRTFADGINIALEEGIGSGHILNETDGDNILYEDNDIKGYTINNLNSLIITGTGSSLDGTTALMSMLATDSSRRVRTNLAMPTHITAVPS